MDKNAKKRQARWKSGESPVEERMKKDSIYKPEERQGVGEVQKDLHRLPRGEYAFEDRGINFRVIACYSKSRRNPES